MRPLSKALSSHPEWSRFLEAYWEKRPFLFENVLDAPMFSEEDLLQTYRIAREAQIVGMREAKLLQPFASVDRNMVMYLEQIGARGEPPVWTEYRAAADLERLLPSPDDRNCADYVARILKNEGCSGLATQLRYTLQGYNPALLEPAEELVGDLFERTGFPGDWTLDCFLGQYQTTAFGVHQDLVEDQLYVSPLATKTIKLWSPLDWESAENRAAFRFNHEGHPVAPIVFRVGPRDVAYWPKDYYHIGESPEVALSVQVNMRPRVTKFAATVLGVVASSFGYRRVRTSQLADGGATLDEAENARTVLKSLLDEQRVRQFLEEDTLLRQSSHFVTNSFNDVQLNFTVPLFKGEVGSKRMRIHGRRKPVWLNRHDSLLVACNGVLTELNCDPEEINVFVATLEELSSGEVVEASQLVARVGSRLPQSVNLSGLVDELIEALWEIGALFGEA